MKWDFGLKDTFVGSWTLESESCVGNEVGATVFEDGVEASSGFGPGFFFSVLLDLLRERLTCECFPLTASFSLFDLFLTGAAFSLVFEVFFVLDVASGWPSFRLRSRRNFATSFDRVGYTTN